MRDGLVAETDNQLHKINQQPSYRKGTALPVTFIIVTAK